MKELSKLQTNIFKRVVYNLLWKVDANIWLKVDNRDV